MDALDLILTQAWDRVSAKLKRDRVLALRRSRRRFKGVLTRPMREWCLVIRASDTRIHAGSAYIEYENNLENHEPHTITLDGKLIRKLTKPVYIPWPGVTYNKAARMLGRTTPSLCEWVRQGVFSINRYAEFKYPRNSKRPGRKPKPPKDEPPRGPDDPPRKIIGVPNAGDGRPYIWTPSPLDPNNFHGRAPHPVWGTLWQHLWENMPEDYELVVQRVPRWREQATKARGVQPRFVGWEFVCPGRLNMQGEYSGCGKRCTYLYAPQTVWTLSNAIAGGDEIGYDMPPPEVSGLAGQWFPGASDPVKDAAGGMRSFACKSCWGVRSACMANYRGWNEFITTISGGLLRGREVERPVEICPIVRKKRKYRRRVKKKAIELRDEQALRAG